MAAYRVLFDDVFDKVQSITEIKTVEDYNGQYDNAENYNIVKYPAVFVESAGVQWNKDLNKFYDNETEPQTGTAQIKVHVVYHTLKGFDKNTKDIYYGIVDTVTSAIQRLQCQANNIGTYQTLVRTNEEYISQSKQLRVCILTFETQLTDVFLEKEMVEEDVTFTINLSQGSDEDPLIDENNVIILDENNEMMFAKVDVKSSFVPHI